MRVYYAILFSVSLHLILYWLTPAEYESRPLSDETPIEVRFVDAPKPTVRETQVPDELLQAESELQDDEPATLWSKEQRRVKKQTKAEATGLTQNRQQLPRPAQQQRPPERKQGEGTTRVPDLMKLAKEHVEQINPQRRASIDLQAPTGISTRGETLSEDIEIGQFTALNVDPYLYYSFFTRIEELIRFRWEDAVEQAVYTLNGNYLSEHNTRWITHLEIELDNQGEYINSRVIQRSGLRSFDLAAVKAFREGRQFPNPPEDLISDDGRVILQYAFEVRWDPRRLVRRR